MDVIFSLQLAFASCFLFINFKNENKILIFIKVSFKYSMTKLHFKVFNFKKSNNYHELNTLLPFVLDLLPLDHCKQSIKIRTISTQSPP